MPRTLPYEQVIAAARRRLATAAERLTTVPYPFRATWWPSEATFEQHLLSDYHFPTLAPELERDFQEEVGAIREALNELDFDPVLTRGQKRLNLDERSLMKSVNIQAEALSVWDAIGVPVRRRGETVWHILAPRDVMGAPIIHPLDVDEYVRGAAIQTSLDATQIARLTKHLERWRVVAIALAVVVALVLTL